MFSTKAIRKLSLQSYSVVILPSFSLQRSPGGVTSRGKVRSLRPCTPGVGEGHHDLYAADEVHVHQHDDLGTLEQETQSCLADVKLALLTSNQPSDHRDQKSQVLSSVQLEKQILSRSQLRLF